MNFQTFFLLAVTLLVMEYDEFLGKFASSTRIILPPYAYQQHISNNTAAGLYNSATEKCCMGSVYPLVSGESCCGQKTIKTDSSICCNEKEVNVEIEVAAFVKCCGEKPYDTRKETCCNIGVIFHVLAGKNKSCCGDKTYDVSNETCCSDFKNDTVSYFVLPLDGKKRSCCVNSVFDPSMETCCNGKVAPGIVGCCSGRQTFNTSTHLCVKGQVVGINGRNLSFCIDGLYDTDKEICCYDVTNGLSTMKLVAKKKPSHSGCCGSETYDRNAQACCVGSKQLVNKASKYHTACCEGKSYDPNSGLCCDNVLYLNSNVMSDAIMVKTQWGTYRKPAFTKTCCGKKIIENSESCCGDSEVFDAVTHMCCDTNNVFNYQGRKRVFSVFEKSSDTLRCCGSKLYDFEKELCCEGQVMPKNGNTQCCGSKSYDVDKEVCCSGSTVFKKENGRSSCCLYGTTDNTLHPAYYPNTGPLYSINSRIYKI